MLDVAQALSHCHKKKVIHRDLKVRLVGSTVVLKRLRNGVFKAFWYVIDLVFLFTVLKSQKQVLKDFDVKNERS